VPERIDAGRRSTGEKIQGYARDGEGKEHSKMNRTSRFGKYLGDLAITLFQLLVFTL
jgi:hypothetical protein